MNVLDLFSGIGGFSLGLERAGFKTVAFCEIEKFPQKVLKKHWPDVPIYEDVRNVTKERLESDGITDIGIITLGFPCQDLSVAGNQKGIEAERSGLWSEGCRIIGDIRPAYAIVENVTALISGDNGRWFGKVLGDLAEIGYDCEWHCISASELGAHHHRDRVWIICYSQHARRDASEVGESNQKRNGSNQEGEKSTGKLERSSNSKILADTNSLGGVQGSRKVQRANEEVQERNIDPQSDNTGESSRVLADSEGINGRRGLRGNQAGEKCFAEDCGKDLSPDTYSERRCGGKTNRENAGDVGKSPICQRRHLRRMEIWNAEPELGRVANGIPDRTHRLKGLGNAVVPQIPEIIGRAIMEIENESN